MLKLEAVEPKELYFEDFSEGQEFPVVTKGPMLVGNQVRWAGACDNYASEFHHDEYVAKAQGLPGKVTRKYQEGGENLIEIECFIDNQKGEVTTPGNALVALPSRAKGSH